jgi:plasmid maintenance system antidote protein VapI
MKKNELESIMKLFGDTGTDLAQFLGIARSTFSAKINETNGAEFTQNEIMLIKQRYQLTPDQLSSIFFTERVS